MSARSFRILEGARCICRSCDLCGGRSCPPWFPTAAPPLCPTFQLPSVSAGSLLLLRPSRFPPWPRRISQLAVVLAATHHVCRKASFSLTAAHRPIIRPPRRASVASANSMLLLAERSNLLVASSRRPPPDRPANPPCPRRVIRLDASSVSSPPPDHVPRRVCRPDASSR